jgi:PAS domain S-box-containing protein
MAADPANSFGENSKARIGLTTLLVLLGCYAGARADTFVAFPQVKAAVFFPPYAILTAALILTPARQWWVYVLAAAIGNFWPHLQLEGISSFVLEAEAANASRALICAWGVRWFVNRDDLFNTLWGMGVFIVFAILVGPAIGAVLGACVVVLHNPSADFQITGQAWLLSNMLTGMTLLPLILIILMRGRRWFDRVPMARMFEAVALCVSLLVVCGHIFTRSHDGNVIPASLYAPLPLLLWAALRFGSGGMIAALSALTTLTIAGTLTGRGPFVGQSPAENLIQLHFFLIALCVPLLLLAAIVQQYAGTAAALLESEANYRSVVEDQTELICRCLPGGTYIFVNGAYCRYFNRTADQLLGRAFWEFIPPEAQEAARAHFATITPDHPIGTIEHEVVAPGGEIRWQQWTNHGFFDEQGNVVGYQSVGRDVTERRLAEEEHRQLQTQKQVAAALRENQARLIESQARLREAISSKDRFLAALSHELRTPLTPVLLAAEAHRHDPGLPEELHRDLNTIYMNATMEVALIDDLLDLTRVGRGKIELKTMPLDVHALLEHAARTCSDETLINKALRISLELGATGHWVMGDPTRLSQVIWNIIKNAIKFSFPGGVITVRTTDVDEKTLAIEFIDTGYGIAPGDLSRIFDAFEQGGRDITRTFGGLGLGLSLCKAFVELHSGKISASSEGRGEGAAFRVELRSIDAPQRPRGFSLPIGANLAVNCEPLITRRGARILLVEDHELTAELLARLLRTSGHNVLNANTVATALETAARSKFDLVISDLGLPDGTGLELMAELARKHGLRGIALSGYGMAEDLRQSHAAGFVEHLVKPVSVEAVQAAISRALGRRDLPEVTH